MSRSESRISGRRPGPVPPPWWAMSTMVAQDFPLWAMTTRQLEALGEHVLGLGDLQGVRWTRSLWTTPGRPVRHSVPRRSPRSFFQRSPAGCPWTGRSSRRVSWPGRNRKASRGPHPAPSSNGTFSWRPFLSFCQRTARSFYRQGSFGAAPSKPSLHHPICLRPNRKQVILGGAKRLGELGGENPCPLPRELQDRDRVRRERLLELAAGSSSG